MTTAILLPFNRLLEKLAILTVPDDKPDQNTLLDERLLSTPAVAVAAPCCRGRRYGRAAVCAAAGHVPDPQVG